MARLWPAILRRSRRDLVDVQLSKVNQQVVEEFAYHQADLLRDQLITREDALAAIAERFPELTSGGSSLQRLPAVCSCRADQGPWIGRGSLPDRFTSNRLAAGSATARIVADSDT
ncbi:hypothetical protein GCM10023176_21970 [Micromonospora coerulea]|uniref:Uncharacterized protein n=1 Tax=Micromonospora coerulea TaxID=47856 RepID=A0ABP8SFA1_9ACTN